VQPEQQVLLDHREQLAHPVPRVVKEFKGQQGQLDFKGPRALQVRPAPPAYKEHRELLVHPVLKDQPVQRAQRERQDQLD
jgi:hypothetical protein